MGLSDCQQNFHKMVKVGKGEMENIFHVCAMHNGFQEKKLCIVLRVHLLLYMYELHRKIQIRIHELCPKFQFFAKHLGWVVQRLDNAIHQINPYLADSMVCFEKTRPLISDLSSR